MNFRINVIFHYVSAWQLSGQPDVIIDGSVCLPLWAVAVPRTSHCMINGLPDKKLKYYNVNVNYKNISDYILFCLSY